MADGEFYVEDESIEEVRAAWKRGEKGETVGKRDLNQRARSVVDRAVARLEASDDAPRVRFTLISGAGSGHTEQIDRTIAGAPSVDATEPVEYRVG